jgi:hypothetical protein
MGSPTVLSFPLLGTRGFKYLSCDIQLYPYALYQTICRYRDRFRCIEGKHQPYLFLIRPAPGSVLTVIGSGVLRGSTSPISSWSTSRLDLVAFRIPLSRVTNSRELLTLPDNKHHIITSVGVIIIHIPFSQLYYILRFKTHFYPRPLVAL